MEKEIQLWPKPQKVYYVLYLLCTSKLPASRRLPAARKLRNWFARRICKAVHPTANIERNAQFTPMLEIGRNSGIGVDCEVHGPVKIGENVMMAPECVIYTQNHSHASIEIPMNQQGTEGYKPVEIKDDVWLGRRVLIMPGVTVERGCIIAAGAVVTKSTEPYAVYGGVPAKKIADRAK